MKRIKAVLIGLIISMGVAACGPPPQPKGNSDYEGGFQIGYERALEQVAHCIEINGTAAVDMGDIGDCLANRSIPGDVSDAYKEGIRRAGDNIHREILDDRLGV